MLRSVTIQIRLLTVHGTLALCLGLALFYLRSTMTNPIFTVFSVAVAILLAAAAIILVAFADWLAAWSEGIKHLQRFTFYLLAGLACALTGVFLGLYSRISMQLLVVFAAVHAFAFGLMGITLAHRAKYHAWERRVMYLFGGLSVVFSGAMAGVAGRLDDPSATVVLGVYLCFVAAKLFYLAWHAHRMVRFAEESNSSVRKAHHALAGHAH